MVSEQNSMIRPEELMEELGIKKDTYYSDLNYLKIKAAKDRNGKAYLTNEQANLVRELRSYVSRTGRRDGFISSINNNIQGDLARRENGHEITEFEESQANSAFSSICFQLENNNLPVPNSINEVTEKEDKLIGVFIMPNNNDEGMLEDLCLQSIENDIVNQCINDYIECCSSIPYYPKEKLNISKTKVRSYLAIKDPNIKSLGISAKKGYWDFEHSCFDKIKTFINKLFN